MGRQRVAVIDYGMGNLHSAASALEHVASDADVQITSDPLVIRNADRLVFPGVGAIRDCMSEIRRLGFDQLLQEQVAMKPVLAICVGMQALMDHSEENSGVDGIGLISGKVRYFGKNLTSNLGERLKVPHMGWNQVSHIDHPMWAKIDQDARFYFVHSYYVEADQHQQIASTTDYGLKFASSLFDNNLFAVQFHPEKSHTNGLQLLANFMQWDGLT